MYLITGGTLFVFLWFVLWFHFGALLLGFLDLRLSYMAMSKKTYLLIEGKDL